MRKRREGRKGGGRGEESAFMNYFKVGMYLKMYLKVHLIK